MDAEAGIRHFHWLKTEWGFDKFLPLETFNDATNGYLVDDCCVFGAQDPSNNTFTWKIEKVSEFHMYSKEFVIGDIKW